MYPDVLNAPQDFSVQRKHANVLNAPREPIKTNLEWDLASHAQKELSLVKVEANLSENAYQYVVTVLIALQDLFHVLSARETHSVAFLQLMDLKSVLIAQLIITHSSLEHKM